VLRVDDDGSALDLRMGDPAAVPAKKTVAPMKVDSQEKVLNLDSDGFDGKSADKIGVNGWRVVRGESNTDSSNSKFAFAGCPRDTGTNMAVVGTGYLLEGAPCWDGNVLVTQVNTIAPPDVPAWAVAVHALEAKPVSGDRSAEAEAICAKAGTP